MKTFEEWLEDSLWYWIDVDTHFTEYELAQEAWEAATKAAKPRWISVNERLPNHGQDCLVKMKHGIHEGTWDAVDGVFSTYIFREVEFYGIEWMPIEDIE